jgi:hypothetical protein
LAGKTREITLLDLAIERNLRACDLVRLLGELQCQAA